VLAPLRSASAPIPVVFGRLGQHLRSGHSGVQLGPAGLGGKLTLAFAYQDADHARALMGFGFETYCGIKVVMTVVRDFRPVRANLTEAAPPNILARIHA
jgi:hypothetical protein